jgi:hypothetical protein
MCLMMRVVVRRDTGVRLTGGVTQGAQVRCVRVLR